VLPGSVRDRVREPPPASAAYATPEPGALLSTRRTAPTSEGISGTAGRPAKRLGNPAAEQALAPFINPVEMALPDLACVIYRVAYGNYRTLYERGRDCPIYRVQFRATANQRLQQGRHHAGALPRRPEPRVQEYDRLGRAVAGVEASPEVNQFSSKYDDYLAGKARLTVEERKGLEL